MDSRTIRIHLLVYYIYKYPTGIFDGLTSLRLNSPSTIARFNLHRPRSAEMCFLSACCWPFVEYDLEEPPRRKIRKTSVALVSKRAAFPKASSFGSQLRDNTNFLHLPQLVSISPKHHLPSRYIPKTIESIKMPNYQDWHAS